METSHLYTNLNGALSTNQLDNDLRIEYALQLGIPNPHDLRADFFEVDRQKLAQMLAKSLMDQDMNIAEYFFESVTKTTMTLIQWPRMLEASVKEKCHIRIFGEIKNIEIAKKQISTYLAPPCLDVILKMYTSFTDHKLIVGQSAENINNISEETTTMIYVPDSNTTNTTNQIDITGSLENVERARSLVHHLKQFTISFYLPIKATENPAYLKTLEETYNVQIELTSQLNTSTTWVLIKSREKEAAQIMDAAKCLLIYVYEHENSSRECIVPVQMDLKISPKYHKFMKGVNNAEILRIMKQTETTIIFPNLNDDMNVQKPLQNHKVSIIGSIDGAYEARKQLLGNLPITLNFDLRVNEIDKVYAAGIKYHTSLLITVEQRYRQNGGLLICIEGKEKDVATIYKAYKEIMF